MFVSVDVVKTRELFVENCALSNRRRKKNNNTSHIELDVKLGLAWFAVGAVL